MRNWLAKKIGLIVWYGGFWCDWCLLPETNWHIVTFKDNKYRYVHRDKNSCWNKMDKAKRLDWVQEKYELNYRPRAGKILKGINL